MCPAKSLVKCARAPTGLPAGKGLTYHCGTNEYRVRIHACVSRRRTWCGRAPRGEPHGAKGRGTRLSRRHAGGQHRRIGCDGHARRVVRVSRRDDNSGRAVVSDDRRAGGLHDVLRLRAGHAIDVGAPRYRCGAAVCGSVGDSLDRCAYCGYVYRQTATVVVRKNMRAATLLLVVVAGVFVAAQQAPQLPAPFTTGSANNAPRVVDAPAGAKLQVPQGFTVETWASGFDMPRYMLLAPGGEILLSDSGAGAVYVFAGGKAAGKKQLISGLSRPFGLAFWQNYLYVAETNSVKRYPYDAKALTVGPGQEVVKVPGGGNHWTRAIVFDRTGQKMYVSVGSSSNITPDPEERAAINRYNPDGSGHEIYAAGTRNPSSIHWYPNSDTLWVTVIERDGLGDNLPPDYFTHVQQGGFYGRPRGAFGAPPGQV